MCRLTLSFISPCCLCCSALSALEKRDCLTELTAHISTHGYQLHLEELEAELKTVFDVKHFLYKSELHSQLVQCVPQQPYASSKHMRKWLFRRYQHVLSRIGATQGEIPYSVSTDATKTTSVITSPQKKHLFYYEVSDFANLFCGQTDQHCLRQRKSANPARCLLLYGACSFPLSSLRCCSVLISATTG